MLRNVFAVAVAALLVGVTQTSAQAPTGSVEGRVVAEGTAAPLAGAVIEVRETLQRVTADGEGRFTLTSLTPGTYTLEVRLLGRRHGTSQVDVVAGRSVSATLTLDVAPVALEALQVRLERTALVGELSRVPGSAHVVDLDAGPARALAYGDVHGLLRQVPGVNMSEEDGHGRRPNIGMRGTGVERSAKITVMEDGVLAAPAPYSAPAAYHFPVVGRMESIEVRKGSSQVRYGPWTTGGALNLVTAQVPADMSGLVELAGGSDATRRLNARVGGRHGVFGWLLQTYQLQTDGFKRLDSGGETGFDLEDYLLKLRVTSPSGSRFYQDLEVKLGRTVEDSRETYLGLTTADFAASPYRRYAGSQADRFDTGHRTYQVRHFIQPVTGVDVTTTVYRNEFERDWYKLATVAGAGIGGVLSDPESYATELGILRGADSGDDALVVRSNNRAYTSQGVQTAVGLGFDAFGLGNTIEAGVRYHRDEEDRFQHDDAYRMAGGRMELTSEGAPGSQANRIGAARALAFFIQDVITFGEWSISPGIRYEDIEFTRTDYAGTDPDRVEPTRVLRNSLRVWVPGLGVMRPIGSSGALFAGVHRGFGPPGPGAAKDTRAESSTNYELGGRWQGVALGAQATAFYNDYTNILGRATLSSGDDGTGELYNGGAALVRGVEASAEYDIAFGRMAGLRVPVRAGYTYTDARFETGFDSDFDEWGDVAAGDRLPYLPTHQFEGGVALEAPDWRIDVAGSMASAMRTRAGSGPLDPDHSTDAHALLNVMGEYAVNSSTRIFAGVQNVTDEVGIVARRPAGVRPALPRTITAGLRLTLP